MGLCQLEYNYKLLKAYTENVCNNLIIDARLDDGQKVTAFCGAPNIANQCQEGTVIWLKRTSNPNRLVKYNVAFIEINDTLIFANPKYDKQLFVEAFENDILEEFDKYDVCLPLGDNKDAKGIDFELSNSNGDKCYVYASSIYLKRDAYAVFPHTINFFEMKIFEEMLNRKKQGADVCVFIIVPREDCSSAKFVWDISTLASGAVYNAAQGGVKFICYSCNVSKNLIEIDHKLDILY